MKVFKTNNGIPGVPDYYKIYEKWINHYNLTGRNSSMILAMHYARVAEEMGQVVISEDTTQEA